METEHTNRKEYQKQYRDRTRPEYNEYQRKYRRRGNNMKKHDEVCKNWRQWRMSPETREKIRQYQREYYRRRKEKRSQDGIKNS